MPYKLLALDIDGTLLDPRGELSARNLAAIKAARAEGVLVVLVTGRRFASGRALVQRLKLDIPLVSHNGALTKNIETLAILDFHPLPANYTRRVIEVGRQCLADMICCDDPHGLGTMVIEGISANNKALHRYLDHYRELVVEVPDLLAYVDHAPIQMTFSGGCAQMDDFAAQLSAALDGQIQLFKTRYRSVDLTILDALSTTASKGASVAAIAAQHNIDRAEIMAIGDNHNDLTMLRYAGLGVVMANAEDELQQMGFARTASNEADGVAEAIERYILQSSNQ